MDKKKIGIMIPCYNEQENIVQICNAVVKEITEELPQYDYEILIMDNCSTDNTRPLIREICKKNPKIKAILNAKNFGQFNSPYYGMLHVDGDCVIPICADFQDPVEMIPQFVHEWENGYKIVCAIKSSSKENKLMYWARSCYYKMIKKMSSVEQIEHFTGFALYDRDFINVLKNLNDPTPFIRGIVAELGFKRKDIEFEQPKRKAGKTHNNFYSLYDAAMLSFTSYTKMGLRIATFAGFGIGILSFLIGIVYLIMKLIWWDRFPGGTAPAIICSMFIGGIQLFFLGFLGEQPRDAADSGHAHHRKHDARPDGAAAAQQPAHKVKLEQAHKPPVDAANDHQDQAHFIKGLHKKTSFPLGSFPHWKGGYACYSIHFGLMTRAPPRSGRATYTCGHCALTASAALRAASSLSKMPNTAAPLPVIRAVTAPFSFSAVLMASLSLAPLHSSSALPAAAHTPAKSSARIAFSWASQSGWVLLPTLS